MYTPGPHFPKAGPSQLRPTQPPQQGVALCGPEPPRGLHALSSSGFSLVSIMNSYLHSCAAARGAELLIHCCRQAWCTVEGSRAAAGASIRGSRHPLHSGRSCGGRTGGPYGEGGPHCREERRQLQRVSPPRKAFRNKHHRMTINTKTYKHKGKRLLQTAAFWLAARRRRSGWHWHQRGKSHVVTRSFWVRL